MSQDVASNQELTAGAHKLAEEKRKLQNLSDKLQFCISTAKMQTLSAEEALRVHRDFDFMHFTTQQDGQAVALQSEEESCDQGEARVVRVFNMVLV